MGKKPKTDTFENTMFIMSHQRMCPEKSWFQN